MKGFSKQECMFIKMGLCKKYLLRNKIFLNKKIKSSENFYLENNNIDEENFPISKNKKLTNIG